MHPAAVFMTRFEEGDELAESLKGLHFSRRSLVVLPLSDNEDSRAAAGGGHWSVLVLMRPQHSGAAVSAIYFDSSPSQRGEAHARRVAAIVAPLLGGGGTSFTTGRLAPQEDGHSCGVYVCAVADAIAARYCEGAPHGSDIVAELASGPSRGITPAYVRAYKRKMAGVVASLTGVCGGGGSS